MRALVAFCGVATICALPRPWREVAAGAALLAIAVWAGYEWGVSDRPFPEAILNAAARARDEAMHG